MERITQHSIPNATLVFDTVFPNGGSSPRVCDFDDDVLRLVKWHPSVHGLTCTYSELIASRLGQLIEAPVVRGSVVYVDNDLLPSDLKSRLQQPFHIGFTYSPGQNFSESDYDRIQNSASLPAAAVQLAWLQIGDQGGHNQYLYQMEKVLPDRTTRKMNHFVIIDQAMICNSFDWTRVDLSRIDAPYMLPYHLKQRVGMENIRPVLDLLNTIPEEEIRLCLDSYPDSWGVMADDIAKLGDFLIGRRPKIEEILEGNLLL